MRAALWIALAAAGCAAPPPEPSPTQGLLGRDRWYGTSSRYDYREAGDTPFTFDTTIGVRMLADEAAWSPVDDQFEVGLAFQVPLLGPDGYNSGSPLDAVSWDFGFRYAFDESKVSDAGGTVVSQLDARTYDVAGGLLISPLTRRAPFEPYVGVGVALLFTDIEQESLGITTSETDSVISAYVRTGARVDLGRGRHVGFDVRWLSGGGARVDGIGADTEGLSMSFLFGVHF